MTNRRHFIQAGLTVSSMSLMSFAKMSFASSDSAETQVFKLDHFIFDDRFSESIALAESIQQPGIKKHAISDDLTKLWYKHLQVDLKQGSKTIAGISSKETLFLLERLAWTYDLRVVYRGKHAIPDKGIVHHEINGAARIVSDITNSNSKSERDVELVSWLMLPTNIRTLI